MNTLQYPFSDIPEPGATLEVAEGVLWLRMPLPMALDHINLYLLEDTDGWWIVDTGMMWGDVKVYWQQVFDNALKGKPIKGVFCTHMHPDHIGQAGWICDKFRAPLFMTSGEYFNARTFEKMRADDLSWTTEEYYRSVGFDDDYCVQMKKNFTGYGKIIEPMPGAFRRIEEGTVFTINGHRWEVVIGRGHSPEHACLYCEDLSVMLSGDQIIPKITSNVSVMPIEPEANPLKEWMESLNKFLQFPDDTLILPAHNTPFKGLHARLQFLLAHHEDHLLALEEACVEPSSASALMPVLFKRELDASQVSMAIGECVAHLNFLLYRKKLKREKDDKGVYLYTSIDPTLSQRATSGPHHQEEVPLQV